MGLKSSSGVYKTIPEIKAFAAEKLLNGEIEAFLKEFPQFRLNEEKQNRHKAETYENNLASSQGHKKSLVTLTNYECQCAILKAAKEGIYNYYSGKMTILIKIDKIVGSSLSRNGKLIFSSGLKVHLSKTGSHVVPYILSDEEMKVFGSVKGKDGKFSN